MLASNGEFESRIDHADAGGPVANEALGFPAVVVPTVNFDNNQHKENENIRVGTLFDSIATIAAILRM